MTLKIFGIFTEIDGEEFETMESLVKSKGLIGSQSADVGTVELYYDEVGNIYAVAHDSEEYFGKKSDEERGESGVHENGIGYAPNGTYCGECSRSTCVGCSVWDKLKSKQHSEE